MVLVSLLRENLFGTPILEKIDEGTIQIDFPSYSPLHSLEATADVMQLHASQSTGHQVKDIILEPIKEGIYSGTTLGHHQIQPLVEEIEKLQYPSGTV